MAAFFVSMHFVYIIYSINIDRFYIGETEDLDTRLDQHNSSFFKGSFTSQASDWSFYLTLQCMDRSHARRVEAFIKKQKSTAFIKRLSDNENMQKDITDRHL
ncbi:GIY-YIG nuclease family protein [Roseivirga sp.]|uniref:GIY-YIG nuclease family protein n=1 Tax=Roseivirga sp. TaxID=1964215 RepID=UPI003B8CFC21